jgi:hypothetical protein
MVLYPLQHSAAASPPSSILGVLLEKETLAMIKTAASIAGLCGLLALVASPTLAQDKMGKMDKGKMDKGKMADHKMSGKMTTHKKVTHHRKRKTHHKMTGKMTGKMTSKTPAKTGGDKMGKDKMKGGKM